MGGRLVAQRGNHPARVGVLLTRVSGATRPAQERPRVGDDAAMEPRYAVDILVTGFPGRSTAHGPLGWSGLTLRRRRGRPALVDTRGFGLLWPLRAALADRGIAPEDVT